MNINEELKFNNKLDFNIVEVCKKNNNPIILYTNKYNIGLKTIKEPNTEVYTFGLIFNFILNITTTIYIICNLNLFYLYKTTNI